MYPDDILEKILENNTRRMVDEIFPDMLLYLEKMSGGGDDKQDNSQQGSLSIEGITKSINGVDKEKASAISEIFKTISNSKLSTSFTDNSSKLSSSIENLSNAINKVNVDEAKLAQVGSLVAGVSALVAVSRSLTFSAPFLVIGAVMSLALIPIAWSISKAFSMFDEETIKRIRNGGEALRGIGWSILLFSASIALSVALIGYSIVSNPIALLALFGVMALSALTFGLIGKFSEQIKDGSWAIVGVSLSLLLFSFSMKIASQNVEDVGMMNMLKLGIVLAGTAFIFGLAGKFASTILWGALAFAGIGIALWLLASPLETISKAVSENSHILWQLPVLLGGLGLVFALAGVATPLILAGSLAFGAVGLALMSIGLGLTAISNSGAEEVDGGKLKNVIVNMIEAFTAISLTDILTIPLKLPAILSLALGLASIGYGMGVYKENAGWSNNDADKFKYTMKSFVEAFTMDVDWEGAEDAIDATWYMGKNLEKLAKGIQAWEEIDFDIATVKGNIVSILTTLPLIFADVGKMNRGGRPTSIVTGWFVKGDVEEGIDASMDMGKNLINLAKGVKEWETIDFDLTAVKKNVTDILTSLPSVFAGIGKMNKGSKPDSWWGAMFEEGDVEEGIRASLDMGKNLKDLAYGVKAWEEIDFDLGLVKKNVRNILTSLPSVFAEIGRQAKESEGIFSDSNHEKGAEIVGMFSDPIKATAELVKSMNDKDLDPKKIKNMMHGIFSTFGQANKLIKKPAMDRLWGMSGAMKKIGKEFPKFNKGLKEFSQIMAKISKDTVDSFLSIANAINHMAKIKYVDVRVKEGKLNSIAGEIIRESSDRKGKTEEAIKKDKRVQEMKNKGKSTEEITADTLGRLVPLIEELLLVSDEGKDFLEKISKKLATSINVTNI